MRPILQILVGGVRVHSCHQAPFDAEGVIEDPLSSLYLPPLSSVRLDGTALGRLVADLILAKIEGRELGAPITDTFEAVVPRASTRRVG